MTRRHVAAFTQGAGMGFMLGYIGGDFGSDGAIYFVAFLSLAFMYTGYYFDKRSE